jgi:adenylosuccinate lyase
VVRAHARRQRNKRISVPEAFLAVDAILNIYINVASGIRVYPKVIEKHINDELPFMLRKTSSCAAVKAAETARNSRSVASRRRGGKP